MINKYQFFIIALLIILWTNSFGQSKGTDFSSFKRKFQDLSCPCQFGKPNCKYKLNHTEIVNLLEIEIDVNYDSLMNQGELDDYYCAEYILRYDNFIGIFYSRTENTQFGETVEISLATFSNEEKLVNSKVLGTNFEHSTDYHLLTSATLVYIESTNIVVTNTSTKLGVNDTINDADSTITKSTFTFKNARIRKIKESTSNNALRKFYAKFKTTNEPLILNQPSNESYVIQNDEIENLLQERAPSKWGIENYRAEYIFKSKTFSTLLYSHRYDANGYEVTDMLMSTFLDNGRLNDTKVLGSQYEYKKENRTHHSSFEIKIDSINIDVKNNTFEKLNEDKKRKTRLNDKSSQANYSIYNGFINENGKSDFKSFCEKFKLAEFSKSIKSFYDKPPYIQDAELKTFLHIETPSNNEHQYYKAEYILKSENTIILIYSQINGLSEKKYSDVFMSTFSFEGKLIDTQMLGTFYEQNKGKYTHHSFVTIKVNSESINVTNVSSKEDNEPYDCSEAIDYRGIETIYTLRNGIISSKPFDYLRQDVSE
jgi:hypothetical protein